MTIYELIQELQQIVIDNPEKKDVEVCIYIANYESISEEEPLEIHSIDNSISDRVDINI